MRTFIISIFFFFFYSSLFAQSVELSMHKVYLKNGSLLTGQIEKLEDGRIKVDIVGDDEVLLNKNKVASIEAHLEGFSFFENMKCLRLKGNYISARYEYGVSEYWFQSGYHLIAGYFPKPKIAVEIGVGWTNVLSAFQRSSTFPTSRISKIPVTFNTKWFLNTRKISPYWIGDIGWAFRLNPSSYYNSYNGSYLVRTGIGVRVATRKSHSLLFELSLAGHQRKYSVNRFSFDGSIITREVEGLSPNLSLNIGIIF